MKNFLKGGKDKCSNILTPEKKKIRPPISINPHHVFENSLIFWSKSTTKLRMSVFLKNWLKTDKVVTKSEKNLCCPFPIQNFFYGG